MSAHPPPTYQNTQRRTQLVCSTWKGSKELKKSWIQTRTDIAPVATCPAHLMQFWERRRGQGNPRFTVLLFSEDELSPRFVCWTKWQNNCGVDLCEMWSKWQPDEGSKGGLKIWSKNGFVIWPWMQRWVFPGILVLNQVQIPSPSDSGSARWLCTSIF